MIKISPYGHCGSAEHEVSDLRPKDFPRNLHIIQCADCHAMIGVVDIHNAVDIFRRGDIAGKKLAGRILSKRAGHLA